LSFNCAFSVETGQSELEFSLQGRAGRRDPGNVPVPESATPSTTSGTTSERPCSVVRGPVVT